MPEKYCEMTVAMAAPATPHDGGDGSPGDTPVKYQDKHQVQNDVHDGGDGQKEQGNRGIAHGTQHIGEIVVEEGGGDSPEDAPEVLAHQGHEFRRGLHEKENPIQQHEDKDCQEQRDARDQEKGDK